MRLQNILDVCIVKTRDMVNAPHYQLANLVESHSLIQQARDDFIAGKLELWEYLELVEMHEVNVDSYLNTVEQNLEVIGI